MSELQFHATVSPDCKLVQEDRVSWMAALSTLRGERLIVTLEKPKKTRSARANRYWWSCVVPIFQEVWSIGRVQAGLPPYDRDQTHDVLVQVLGGYEDGPMPGTRVRKPTSQMSSAEFAKLVDDARELALHQYGMAIPAPGEKWSDE